MTKQAAAKTRQRKTPEYSKGHRVLGVTRDGVKILKQPGKPDSFTIKELREAIARVRAAKTGG